MVRCPRSVGLAPLVVAVAVTVSGCASAAAQVALPDARPLAIPPAPARVVVPSSPEPPPQTMPDPPAATAGSSTTSATLPVGPARTNRETRPPATPPANPTSPPAGTTTPATAQPQSAPLEAQANQSDLERRARDLIAAATATLDKIERSALTTDGRAQYDTARRFIEQAATALKTRNVVYGWQLADKANTIATLLQRR